MYKLKMATITRTLLFTIAVLMPVRGNTLDVRITSELESLEVMHEGKKVLIQRNQDPGNTVNPIYALTSRKCPPFCVQPEIIDQDVETIGEIEMLAYLKRVSEGDDSVLVIDSRKPGWLKNGTIPGSVNIPWTMLSTGEGADPFEIADILEKRFGVRAREGLWDFSSARTLVLFCNGLWCGQSPSNIRSLLHLGYPPSKLKWYRGGMQNWEILGLTVVK